MKAIFKGVLLACLITTGHGASAEERGTADEAIAMVKKAVAYYKANGKEKTIAEINNQTGMFEDKDLYVFMQPIAPGPALAHGGNPRMAGKILTDLRDVDGVYFARKMHELAAGASGQGWVNYKWPNVRTGQLEAKSTYIERAGDVYFGCSIYKGPAVAGR